ncbi:phage tail protein [Brevibacillus borstelensis]|jgi:Phage tail sheath protein beta-sandwich domain|uniref:phage tail sheath N-terminal beta-sandwich domain-containing protein n=1 Tax=Brevibacillus TaxID=55080 RepID=UPI000F08170F|nr:phage tail sheath N-terminal beta-sandwich domain-containing protein [Brevibacillus borstelensis]MED1745740.1 phage tail sheath N-terminal beta-sandwich domain-containing protein [Brevibacillus borstelensis]MED1883087.1 phage tail sheath N-terminal beta-sandwich domain-containing protein [Brevibacillus borstelensis]MED2008691.1 phage tail sheath N-terminal beta-sandwich domain-containing protein [Brevibacillus borstelensis]RNB55918.1 phage tail protein [Brevibacillus borstelensis]GED54934.1
MAGLYQPGEEKALSGVYSFLKSFIKEQTTMGIRGKLALPIVAHWGPIGEFVTVRTKASAQKIFGATEEFELIWASDPHPTEVLLYRVAGESAAAASATLKGAATEVLKVEAKHKGELGNSLKVVVQPNLIDHTKIDVLVYRGAELVDNQTGGTVDELVEAFQGSEFVVLKKLADGLPDPTAGVILSGGNSGTSVEATKYTAYQNALATQKGKFGVFTLGIADPALNAAAEDWTKQQCEIGNYVKFVFGGDSNRDKDKKATMKASTDANHMAVVNVGSGVHWRGKTYHSAKLAIYIASLMASMPLNYTMALYITPFESLTVEWDEATDLIEMVQAGALMLNTDNNRVIIQEPVNTLTIPGPNQSKDYGKIRVADTFHTILHAEEKAGKEWIRQQPNSNSPARRAAFCQMMKREVFKPLAMLEVIADDYEYIEDPDYHGDNAIYTPARNAGHFIAGFRHQDALEKIYIYNKSN